MKRFAQTGRNRSFKVQSNATPQALRLFDFIGKHRDKRATQSYHSKLNRTSQSIDMWKQRALQLNAPSKVDVCLSSYISKGHGSFLLFKKFLERLTVDGQGHLRCNWE